MVSIVKECTLICSPDHAWSLLADPGAAQRAFPGVLAEARPETGGRLVTFADGTVVREAILGLDPARRRVAYTVVGARFAQHAASMQILPDAAGCRFVWWSDVLPDEHAPLVGTLMEHGVAAFRRAATGDTA